jgi:hypothetical protein
MHRAFIFILGVLCLRGRIGRGALYSAFSSLRRRSRSCAERLTLTPLPRYPGAAGGGSELFGGVLTGTPPLALDPSSGMSRPPFQLPRPEECEVLNRSCVERVAAHLAERMRRATA